MKHNMGSIKILNSRQTSPDPSDIEATPKPTVHKHTPPHHPIHHNLLYVNMYPPV